MSLKDLSKEQKQYVALGLLAAAILVNLMVLGIRFSMATVSAAKVELDDLTAKISSANQSLSRSRQTSEDYLETVAVLKEYLTDAPPERNYYSWATQVIYSKARIAELEIDSIDEITMPQRQRSGPDDAAAISFESYSLRISAHGGYENTKYFLNLLKRDYPLVRFSGVEISSGQSQDQHDVQLFMQWPFNFGEISKNWDAVANKKMKVAEFSDGQEVAALKAPGSATPAAAVAKPDPVREPYPPTTRPGMEEALAPKPAVEPTAAKTLPGMDEGSHVAPLPFDRAHKPATDEEIQAILSNVAAPVAARMDAELQQAGSESESIVVEPQPVQELEIIAPEPEPVIEPAIIPDPVIEPQSVEEPEPTQAPESGTEPKPTSGMEPQPQTASAAEAPRNYVSTGKTEKILEELLNKGSTREDASLSSFLDGLVGEINEK